MDRINQSILNRMARLCDVRHCLQDPKAAAQEVMGEARYPEDKRECGGILYWLSEHADDDRSSLPPPDDKTSEFIRNTIANISKGPFRVMCRYCGKEYVFFDADMHKNRCSCREDANG